MRRPSRKSNLLIVSLSVVALSGCTRFDPRDSVRRFPIEVSRRTTATQQIETPILPSDTPSGSNLPDEASPQALPSMGSTSMDQLSVEPVLDELDAALAELESLIGSTENWEVPQP
jgi:hypothetical protein